ncbi:hypothetical protein [Nocardia abscessus]|uniref:hypothetical protein n=1 Tax=Nocardia abscessus TaxID=120957 RepID=UPI002455DA37|nr:hypothetical protein [Nocardia abscessus]
MKPTTASVAVTVLLTCDKTGPDETSAAPGVRVEEMVRLAGGALGDAPVRDVR